MVISKKNSGSLITGGNMPGKSEEVTCYVLRPIFIGRKRQEVGAELSLPLGKFRELESVGKVGTKSPGKKGAAKADAKE
jgi:hypothetical protein